MSDDAFHPAAKGTDPASASAPPPAPDRLAAYVAALGVTAPDAAARLADALRRQAAALRPRAAGPGQDQATPDQPAPPVPSVPSDTRAAIAALDAFLETTVARIVDEHPADPQSFDGPPADGPPDGAAPSRRPAAVRFTLARYLGPLLSEHPDAPVDPAAAAAFTAELAHHHDARPGGVLPAHPHQEMPRQPLGALPAVLRSQFWTSAYRFGPFGNRRNSAAADDSPRPAGVAENPPVPAPPAGVEPTETPT